MTDLTAEGPALVAHLNALAGTQILPDSDGNFAPTVTGDALLNAAEMIERLAAALAASEAARVKAERERNASDAALLWTEAGKGDAPQHVYTALEAARARKKETSVA